MKKLLALWLLCCIALGAGLASAEGIAIPEIAVAPSDIPDNEAIAFLRSLGLGWDLGNTFDAYSDRPVMNDMTIEKSWVGTYVTRELLQAVKDAGFGFIRIPVSWHNHLGANYTIKEPWLNRVQEVVDWSLDVGLAVILNTHHDVGDTYYYPDSAHMETSTRFITRIWEQLAERFRDYDSRLIFESMNEPRLVGTGHEWWLEATNAQCMDAAASINSLNQTFVDTVRAAGGNNADRYLMVPGYAANPDYTAPRYFTLPNDTADNRLIVSTHAYVPYSFALDTKGTDQFSWNNRSNRNDITKPFKSLYSTFIAKGIPVVMGECGCLSKNNLQMRVEWSAAYAATAAAYGIPIAWWDNGAFTGSGENFGLFNRETAELVYPEIVEALLKYGVRAD